MVSCPRCTTVPDDPPLAVANPLSQERKNGDICCVFESLATPIEMILQDTPAIQANPRALERSQKALKEIRTGHIGKLRPCVLLRQAIKDKRPANVALMGTLGSKPMHKLPRLFRHFCIPVYPNLGLTEATHIHSNPEWKHPHQWVVAYSVLLGDSNTVEKHWGRTEKGTQADAVVYTMDQPSLFALREDCRRIFKSWRDMCTENEALAFECEAEFRKHDARLSNYSLYIRDSSSDMNLSLRSRRTSRAPSRQPSLHTVQEDPLEFNRSGHAEDTHARSPLRQMRDVQVRRTKRTSSMNSMNSMKSTASKTSTTSKKSVVSTGRSMGPQVHKSLSRSAK